MQTIYYADLSSSAVVQQLVVAAFLNKQIKMQPVPAKNVSLCLVEDSLVIEDPNSVSFHIAANSKLVGFDVEEETQIYSWLEYFNMQVFPLINQLYGQVFGSLPSQKNKFTYALEELRKTIKVFDDQLKMRSFFVADRITLADVIICCQMDKAFRLLITTDMRKKLTNLTRWFSHVRQCEPFVKKLGKMFLCNEKGFQPVFEEEKIMKQETETIQIKIQESEGVAEDKKQESSGFNMENFKRSFQNEQNKQEVINQLLNNFPAGWSIWKIHYIKDVEQGKVDYTTANMCRGTVQRLSELRKNGFGFLSVYFNQETKEYEIRGVMFWKGDTIAKPWEEQGSYEYHAFTKLNPAEANDQQLVKDYWLMKQKAEGLTFYSSQKLI